MPVSEAEDKALRKFNGELDFGRTQATEHKFPTYPQGYPLRNCDYWDYNNYLEDANIPLDYKVTAAALNGKWHDLEELNSESGADLSAPLDTPYARGRNAVGVAVIAGQKDLVKKLVYQGVDPNCYSDTNNAPLHDAVSLDPGFTRILLSYPEIDPNKPDDVGASPLFNAARLYHGQSPENQIRDAASRANWLANIQALYEDPRVVCAAKTQHPIWGEEALKAVMNEANQVFDKGVHARVALSDALQDAVIEEDPVAHSFVLRLGTEERMAPALAALCGVYELNSKKDRLLLDNNVRQGTVTVVHASRFMANELHTQRLLNESRAESARRA